MRKRAALVWLALAGGAAAGPPDAGRALFEGLSGYPGEALIGTTPVPAARFPCLGCHGRDGRGGSEGDAPPITWDVLSTPAADRPAYDREALGRLLAEGEVPGGRVLSRQMPRYALDAAALDALAGHLAALPAEQRRGIGPDRIVLAVPIPPDNAAAARRMADALVSAFAARIGGAGIYGRRIEIRPLDGPAEAILSRADAEAAAVIGLVPSRALPPGAFLDRGIAVLFPRALLSGDEDPTLARSLSASGTSVTAALEEGVRRTFPRAGVLSLPGRAIPPGLVPVDPGAPLPPDLGVILVGTGDAEALPALIDRLPGGVTLYGPIEVIGPARARIAARGLRAVAAVGNGPLLAHAAAHGTGPEDSHAGLSARVIAEALARAGRDLTRAGLVAAIGDLDLPEVGLDFAPGEVAGTRDIRLIPLPTD